ETLNGKIGLPYQTTAKSINGWTVKAIPANANGTFTDQAQTVTYVYERTEAAPVTVKYVDEESNELATSDTLNGEIGLPYQSTAKSINGWTVKETPANANGTFTEQAQTVTYVYEKTKSNQPIIPPTNIDKENNISSSKPVGDKSNSSLPQAGEQQSSRIWGVLGILLLGSSVLVVGRRRKNQN
ncbi:TPA: MucBP domain-containing protein, partial [Klebsiella aerogenes]|nr:MucBP domain-containing protein [Klebsiella aerogenes]